MNKKIKPELVSGDSRSSEWFMTYRSIKHDVNNLEFCQLQYQSFSLPKQCFLLILIFCLRQASHRLSISQTDAGKTMLFLFIDHVRLTTCEEDPLILWHSTTDNFIRRCISLVTIDKAIREVLLRTLRLKEQNYSREQVQFCPPQLTLRYFLASKPRL